MKNSIVKPDAFAIGLFCVGIIMLFLPMMRMPGIIAIVLAPIYWLVITTLRFVIRHRSPSRE